MRLSRILGKMFQRFSQRGVQIASEAGLPRSTTPLSRRMRTRLIWKSPSQLTTAEETILQGAITVVQTEAADRAEAAEEEAAEGMEEAIREEEKVKCTPIKEQEFILSKFLN